MRLKLGSPFAPLRGRPTRVGKQHQEMLLNVPAHSAYANPYTDRFDCTACRGETSSPSPLSLKRN